MAVDTLYIHIGAHKEGSSALQTFLKSNREALRAEGVHVPSVGMMEGYGHHSNIVWEDLKPGLFDATVGRVQDVVADLAAQPRERALISSEEFELLRREAIDAFLDAFRQVARRICLILYVRPQNAYASSAYFQALKAGNISYFKDFFGTAIHWNRMRYDTFFRSWEEQPRTSLIVRPMTQAVRRSGIERDLLSILDLADQADRF
jgi:hypothetical protein